MSVSDVVQSFCVSKKKTTSEHPVGTPLALVHNTQWSPCGHQRAPTELSLFACSPVRPRSPSSQNPWVLLVSTVVPLLLIPVSAAHGRTTEIPNVLIHNVATPLGKKLE